MASADMTDMVHFLQDVCGSSGSISFRVFLNCLGYPWCLPFKMLYCVALCGTVHWFTWGGGVALRTIFRQYSC